MKITNIAIGPAGFSGIQPIPEIPPEPPPHILIPDSLVITNYTYTDTDPAFSSIYRIDPITYDILERIAIDLPLSVSSDGVYHLFETKVYNNEIYVFVKADPAVNNYWDGPPFSGDYWALMKFDPSDLTNREIIAIGSSFGGVENGKFDRESIRIVDDVAYVGQMALDFSTNIERMNVATTEGTHFAVYGYALTGGDTIFRNDHGVLGGSFAEQRPFSFTPNGIYTYTVGEDDPFNDITDSKKIYKGKIENDYQFNEEWFDGSVLGDEFGRIWSVGAVDPDNGHVFCWILDETFPTVRSWYLLELDVDASIVQTIDVTTTLITSDPDFTIPGVIAIHDGIIYTTIYLGNGVDEVGDGVWIIDPSGPSGHTDPAFQLGESAEFAGGTFDSNIIRGIDYFKDHSFDELIFDLTDSSGNGNNLAPTYTGTPTVEKSLIASNNGAIGNHKAEDILGEYISPTDLTIMDNSWWACGWVESTDEYSTIVTVSRHLSYHGFCTLFTTANNRFSHQIGISRADDGIGGSVLKTIEVFDMTPGPRFIFGSYNSVTDTYKLYENGVLYLEETGNGHAFTSSIKPNSITVGERPYSSPPQIGKTIYDEVAFGVGIVDDSTVSDLYALSNYSAYVAAQLAMSPFGYWHLNSSII